jgi:hypothetical protein
VTLIQLESFYIPPHNFNKATCFQINRFTACDELFFDVNQSWDEYFYLNVSSSDAKSKKTHRDEDRDYKLPLLFYALSSLPSRCVIACLKINLLPHYMQILKLIWACFERWKSNNSISKRETFFAATTINWFNFLIYFTFQKCSSCQSPLVLSTFFKVFWSWVAVKFVLEK